MVDGANRTYKTYYIKTFGCQANKSDSERIEGDYQARGYKPAKDWRRADEIIVNTCAVRERAEHRARGFIYNVVQYSQASKKPKPKIILTGCMTHHGEKKLLEMIPELDEVLPITKSDLISSQLEETKFTPGFRFRKVVIHFVLFALFLIPGDGKEAGRWKMF